MADVTSDVKTTGSKNVVITGGNQGIGLQTAIKLSELGYVVTISARSDTKGKEAVASIIKAVPGAKIDYLLLDLLSLQSVKAFASAYNERGVPLHVLLNNAGTILKTFEQTKDGVEATWQVNHLSHFLLTYLLWPRLQAAGQARVINVSSKAHRAFHQPFDIKDVTNVDATYDAMRAYGRSKLANILFTRGLESRLKNKGVTFYSLHPGLVDTGLLVSAVDVAHGALNGASGISVDAGSRTSVYLATTPGIEKYSGGYFDESRPSTELTELAQSKEEEDKLWAASLQLAGLSADAFA